MVDERKKIECNGCRACADICPVGAISFEDDALTGFAYPLVKKSVCTGCGLCERKCTQASPVRMPGRLKEPRVYAAWSNDDEARLLCTSGALFYELARYVIEARGGCVAACSYTADYRGSYHYIASTLDELIPQCGSKYVQSDTTGIYGKVRERLAGSPCVFFVGSPCQVAGLYAYLGGESDNLLTADFICNSINSPKAQAKYIDYLEERFGSRLVFARAKDKRYGWNNFGSSARFENGSEYYASRNEDARVVGYHRGHLFIRESCTDCKYKVLPRNADITLADFWGIGEDERNPKMEMGTSLVMTNTEKGEAAFKGLSARVSFYEETLQKAARGNPCLFKSVTTNGNSAAAFAALATKRFDRVVDRYKSKIKRPSLARRTLSFAKRAAKRMLKRS